MKIKMPYSHGSLGMLMSKGDKWI